MKKSQKKLVTNPLLYNEFGARGQVYLIDMRTNPEGEFNPDTKLSRSQH